MCATTRWAHAVTVPSERAGKLSRLPDGWRMPMLLETAAATRTLDPAGTHALGQRLLGSVITPDQAEYDVARRVWNKEFVRQPALVVRAADALDVVQAV